jgi:hypothetical protein
MADGYQPDSNGYTGSPGYQSDTAEPSPASEGFQSGSGEPAPLAEVPESGSADPHQAFAEVAAKTRDRKKREREPGTWMPNSDDLDREDPLQPDGETRFSRDSWGGRGNPQVSVRLRPRDFERLRRAADLYGVRPTTVARMMVIRGVGAVIEADNARKASFLSDP